MAESPTTPEKSRSSKTSKYTHPPADSSVRTVEQSEEETSRMELWRSTTSWSLQQVAKGTTIFCVCEEVTYTFDVGLVAERLKKKTNEWNFAFGVGPTRSETLMNVSLLLFKVRLSFRLHWLSQRAKVFHTRGDTLRSGYKQGIISSIGTRIQGYGGVGSGGVNIFNP